KEKQVNTYVDNNTLRFYASFTLIAASNAYGSTEAVNCRRACAGWDLSQLSLLQLAPWKSGALAPLRFCPAQNSISCSKTQISEGGFSYDRSYPMGTIP